MLSSTALAVSAASVLFSLPVNAGLYTKSSPVLQLNAKSYDQLIAKSNHTSIVEFYAPWCGHCQNLKPAYEKAAKNLAGLAKVAAVDCDEEKNKAFCGSMGVQGFPTLKIVRPGKKAGKPVVEDYQGARAAKAIVDAVVDKIPNHVKRVTDKGLDTWMKEGNDTAKAILFSDKGTTSALLRALAIDYLGSISFAQIRDKEKDAVSTFGVSKYPTFMLLPGGDKDAVVYDGELKKDAMSTFLASASGASPNPDPAPAAPKKEKAEKAKKDSKKDSAKESDTSSMKLKATSLSLENEGQPTESPDPKVVTPPAVKVDKESAPMILMLEQATALQRECLAPKSHICILALLPLKADRDALLPKQATQALISLGEVQQKHSRRHSALFPFYSVPAENELGQRVRSELGLKDAGELDIVAVNAKRGWWRRYPEDAGFSHDEVEAWVDVVRMNEGPRGKLPEGLVLEVAGTEEPAAEQAKEPEPPKANIVIEDLGEVDEDDVPAPEPEKKPVAKEEIRDEL